jgi:tetratricopeptide (TPR) repeat protein
MALQELAALRLDRKDPGAALEILDQIMPDSPQAKTRQVFLLARAAILQNDNDQALKLLAPLVPLDSAMATETVLLHSKTLGRSGRYQEAENLLEEFIAANPNAPGLNRVFWELDQIYSSAGPRMGIPPFVENWPATTWPSSRRVRKIRKPRLLSSKNFPLSRAPIPLRRKPDWKWPSSGFVWVWWMKPCRFFRQSVIHRKPIFFVA